MTHRNDDAINDRADFEAEMARDGATDWDSLTPEQQAEVIAEQEAAAWVAAEYRAEQAMSFGYGS